MGTDSVGAEGLSNHCENYWFWASVEISLCIAILIFFIETLGAFYALMQLVQVLSVEALFQPKMHQMWFGGRSPPGVDPLGEFKRSPTP